ncbi:MAG: hypothetical protein Q7S10_00980, partial [bacterium]|nr:hypothetical protein [bacterium]
MRFKKGLKILLLLSVILTGTFVFRSFDSAQQSAVITNNFFSMPASPVIPGQMAKFSVVFPKSAIESDRYLVALPPNAKNITIKRIGSDKAHEFIKRASGMDPLEKIVFNGQPPNQSQSQKSDMFEPLGRKITGALSRIIFKATTTKTKEATFVNLSAQIPKKSLSPQSLVLVKDDLIVLEPILPEEPVLPTETESVQPEAEPTPEVEVEIEVEATPDLIEESAEEEQIPVEEEVQVEVEEEIQTEEQVQGASDETPPDKSPEEHFDGPVTIPPEADLVGEELPQATETTSPENQDIVEPAVSEEIEATDEEIVEEYIQIDYELLMPEPGSSLQILTPSGYKSVAEVKPGDQVVGYDLEQGKTVINTVENAQSDTPEKHNYFLQDEKGNNTDQYVQVPFVYYLVNGQYKLYKNQSLWASDRVVHAFELTVGDVIYDSGGKEVTIEKVEPITAENLWINFDISGNHSYIIDGIIMHNASRYWVGGGSSANWNATGNTNWGSASNTQDNASVPASTDDVFFDGVGTGASNSTLSADITIRSLNMTGYTNTLTHNSAVTLSIGDATAGASNNALIFDSLTYTLGSATTSAISFVSTSTTQQNVNFNSKTAGNVTFNGVAGTWKLTGTFNTGSTATVTLTNGTFDTDGQIVSIGLFSSSNSNTRVLTLGGLTTLTVAGTGTPWDTSTTTGITLNVGTSTVTLSGADTTFAGGGLTYYTLALTGSGTQIISGANTYNTLTRTGTAAKTDILQLNANQTVTSGLNLNGNSATNRILVKSDTLGTARTITSNALISMTSNVDFRDITGAGTMSWDLSAITGKSGDAGGNTSITFTTAQTNYWIAASPGDSSGNWSDAMHWSTTSGGGFGGRVPLPQDSATFDASSIDAGSRTITADMPRLAKTINWTGATNTPTFDISSIDNTLYGSLTLISGMNLTTGTSSLIFEGRSSFTLTAGGKTFGPTTVQMVGGTLTLQDTLTVSSSKILDHNNGTFSANNQNLSLGSFRTNSSGTRTMNMGSGTWTLTGTSSVWNMVATGGLTFNANTSTIVISDTSTTAKSFNGANLTYNTVTFSGDNITVTGSNTFSTFNLDTAGLANGLKLTSGITQTVTTFASNGSAGNLAKLVSTSAGSAATLSKASGTVSEDYMSIKDSTATGGASWYAGANSTNVSGNTGWTFTAPGVTIGGTVYTDAGTTNIGANKTVAVSVNGAAAAGTDDTDASGVYSIPSITVVAGDVLTLYLEDETEDGVTVTV